MLALVIDHAAAVDAVALDGQGPRVQAWPPAFRHGAHHVAVAVDQHGGQRGILDAGADQHRTVDGIGVAEDLRGETQFRDHRAADVMAVAFQLVLAQRRIALSGNGDECPQALDEAAVVEAYPGAADRAFACPGHPGLAGWQAAWKTATRMAFPLLSGEAH